MRVSIHGEKKTTGRRKCRKIQGNSSRGREGVEIKGEGWLLSWFRLFWQRKMEPESGQWQHGTQFWNRHQRIVGWGERVRNMNQEEDNKTPSHAEGSIVKTMKGDEVSRDGSKSCLGETMASMSRPNISFIWPTQKYRYDNVSGLLQGWHFPESHQERGGGTIARLSELYHAIF